MLSSKTLSTREELLARRERLPHSRSCDTAAWDRVDMPCNARTSLCPPPLRARTLFASHIAHHTPHTADDRHTHTYTHTHTHTRTHTSRSSSARATPRRRRWWWPTNNAVKPPSPSRSTGETTAASPLPQFTWQRSPHISMTEESLDVHMCLIPLRLYLIPWNVGLDARVSIALGRYSRTCAHVAAWTLNTPPR